MSVVKEAAFEHISQHEVVFVPQHDISFKNDPFLSQCLESLVVSDLLQHRVQAIDAVVKVEVFQLSEEEPFEEHNQDNDSVFEAATDTPACDVTTLPHRLFHHLWESLIFDSDLKQQLLQYIETAMVFSDKGVDPNLITFNRVLLLHGPPGTGKTSICRALAQRAAIRLGERFEACSLMEINAHSLFSKWFSESGKLVGKVFKKIREIVQDEGALCFILIDEVESLAAARKSALSGAEPSDALRVVNALLTQLDSLRRFSNVFIMATSNITEAIDIAFIDRADLKLHVGLPSVGARYSILASAVKELLRSGLLSSSCSLPPAADMMDGLVSDSPELTLQSIAHRCEGMSGRMLRKLPFLAFSALAEEQDLPYSMDIYLHALNDTVAQQIKSRGELDSR